MARRLGHLVHIRQTELTPEDERLARHAAELLGRNPHPPYPVETHMALIRLGKVDRGEIRLLPSRAVVRGASMPVTTAREIMYDARAARTLRYLRARSGRA